MQMVHANVAVEAASILQAWRTGGFAALRAHTELSCPDSGSLLDLERRDLLNAVIRKIEEAADDCATGDIESPDVRVETCLSLLRHLGDQSNR